MLSPESPAFLEAKARIKAIFFDLDGTLIDSDDVFLERWAARLRPVARLFPGGEPTRLLRRVLLAAEGPVNGLITLLDKLGLDDELFAIFRRVRGLREQRAPREFVPVDGAVEAIHSLQGAYRLGIVTTRSRGEVLAFLRQFDLSSKVEALATREDTERLKPHPQPIQHALSQIGLPASECAMVGDTAVDVVSARAAGVYAVGVLCGFGEREELLQAGADLILENTAELSAWF